VGVAAGTLSAAGLKPGDRLIVGLSGGADSVALLAVLKRLGYRCVAAHVGYGLRGEESERDRIYARDVALRLEVPFEFLDARMAVAERPGGESVEMACRRVRYEWFEKLRLRFGADLIAIAHHIEDSDETFFINLLRGTGIRGLRGIRELSGHIVRPLLRVSRADIERFLDGIGLRYVVDSSNLGDDYVRNRVRHHVIPALTRVDGAALAGLRKSMAMLGESAELLEALIERATATCRRSDGSIDVMTIINEMPMPETSLYALLAPLGFNRSVSDLIARAVFKRGERQFKDNAGNIWVMEHGILSKIERIMPPVAEKAGSLAGLSLDVKEMTPAEMKPDRTAAVAYFDADLLECGNPVLELRPWCRGDRIAPFGMKHGSRLVSDLLKEARVPSHRRRHVLVLVRDGVILWIPGIRSSRHFIVGDATRRVVAVSLVQSQC